MDKNKTYYLSRYARNGMVLVCCFVLFLGLTSKSQDSSLTVISNPKGAPANLRMAELKSTLLGEKQRWNDGTKVVIAMVKSTTPLGEVISKRIYAMSGDGVRGFWARVSFAGKYDPPNVFNNTSELENFVAQNPGAIAILDKPSGNNDVKVVLIDGKKAF